MTGTPDGAVATIGNFDGVHIGHQAILKKLKAKSRELELPSIVIAFEPSANEFFLGSHAPPRLTNFREKFCLIDGIGINRFVCLSFNRALATMHAEAFVEDILIARLNIRHLTVGDDFHFGKDREGDYELLKNMGKDLSFNIENTESVVVNGDRVRSSTIRDYLADGRTGSGGAVARAGIQHVRACHSRRPEGTDHRLPDSQHSDQTQVLPHQRRICRKGKDRERCRGTGGCERRLSPPPWRAHAPRLKCTYSTFRKISTEST